MRCSRQFRRQLTGAMVAIGLVVAAGGCASPDETANPADSQSSGSAAAQPSQSAATSAAPSSATPHATGSSSAAPSTASSALRARSDLVLTALAKKDYLALARLVDPAKGLRFSPSSYIDVAKGVVMTPAQVAALGTDKKRYTWGSDAGSGEPIRLTFAAYNKKFGYDQDFLHAEQVAQNRTLGEGSSLHNTAKVFPSAQFVDYHFTGFDPQFDGLDWETLRVIMRKSAGKWYVVGLVHNSWTP